MLIRVDSRELDLVLSRNETISESEYERELAVFSGNDHDITHFNNVPQLPE